MGTSLLVSIFVVLAGMSEASLLKYEDLASTINQPREVSVEPLGCYKMSSKFFPFFDKMRFKTAEPSELIQECASRAAVAGNLYRIAVSVTKRKRYSSLLCREVFGSPDEWEASSCGSGIGSGKSVYVYRLNLGPRCHFNGNLYNEGETMLLPDNSTKAVVADAKFRSCTCRQGRAENCTLSDCDTGYLQGCEKLSIALGNFCPTCECAHNGRRMSPKKKWAIALGDDFCLELTCQDSGRADGQRLLMIDCKCANFVKLKSKKRAADPCCELKCKGFKPPKPTRRRKTRATGKPTTFGRFTFPWF